MVIKTIASPRHKFCPCGKNPAPRRARYDDEILVAVRTVVFLLLFELGGHIQG